jgi:hypothetical protein
MTKPRRKPPTLRQKLAAALLTMVRDDGHGNLVPIIPYAEARAMTTEEILSRFQWDHSVYVTWNGSNHPTNLTPLPIAVHREKTKRDVKAIAKVRRSEKRKAGQKRRSRHMQYTAFKDTHKRTLAGRTEKRLPT